MLIPEELYIIAKNWKPKCSSTAAWIKKLAIHTMEYMQ